MVFRRFQINCVIRVLVLIASIFLVAFLLLRTAMYSTIGVLSLLIVYQIWALISYITVSNRHLNRFLQSIEYSDFSQRFTTDRLGSSFDEVTRAFNSVLERFREVRSEKEENFRYLQAVVQHVGIGMLAYEETGEITLWNAAAKRLFDLTSLKSIEDLNRASPKLAERLRRLEPGKRDLVTVPCHGEMMQLAIYVTELRQRERRIRLVSFQNISSELNEREMQAWQKLIRVLTHEIKNSLTPIASLTATVEKQMTDRPPGGALSGDDVRDALQTIQRRSHGLLQFVDSYRNLTHIPEPEFKIIRLSALLQRVEKLVLPDIAGKEISYTSHSRPESLELTADPQMVEQVLINLLLNATQSLDGRKGARIEVTGRLDERGRVVIEVTDNGPGIIEDALEKIFVPFYTTRKGGSGIGLSLSRQIMRLHRGELTVRSDPERETVFAMRF